jgi:hypothetical protein
MGSTVSAFTREVNVTREIEAYIAAVNTYPERFERDPSLSFQQHLFRVVAAQASIQTAHDHNTSAA